jgi:hypothetical protein
MIQSPNQKVQLASPFFVISVKMVSPKHQVMSLWLCYMSISAYSSNSITIIVIILHFLIYTYIVFLKINILNPIYWKFKNVCQFQKSNINYFDVIYFCHSFCSFHITPTNVNIKNKKAFEIEIKQNNIVFFIRLMWLSFSLLNVPLKYMGLCKKYWRQCCVITNKMYYS